MRGAAAVFVLVAAASADGWIDHEGKPCPELTAQQWFNTGGEKATKASLRGKVVLVFFFGESTGSADEVGYLSWLFDRYGDKGLRIVALTTDPPEVIEKLFVKQLKARYWIGCDGERTTFGRFVQVGIATQMPQAYLVGTDGKVLAHGKTIPEETIRGLVEELFDAALGRDLHAALAGACADYGKGDVGKAWAAAGRRVADPDAPIAEDAKFLVAKCEARAAFTKRIAEKRLAAKDFPAARKKLDDLAGAYAPMEVAAWAAQKKCDLDADPEVRRELLAWQELEKIAARERKAGGDPRKLEAVRKEYRALIRKHPGTRAAQVATERAGGA